MVVAAIAGGLRFHHLDRPRERIFDEVYYSKDGCLYAGYEPGRCAIESADEKGWVENRGETSWVHPPLGKWMIAAGERAFGPDSFGWRVSAAVFGTASVVLVALIAQLLLGSAAWTFLTGLLLATENLNFVQSRTAMLDIFLAFWVVLGFLFLLLDRGWMDRRTPLEGPAGASPDDAALGSPILRPWRIAAGVTLGAAVATKWSGVLAVASAVLLAFAWERTRRARAGVRRPLLQAVRRESLGIVTAFAVVPLAAYLVSYAGWFADNGLHAGEWWRLQADMASYHLNLETIDASTGEAIHPYLSSAWTWILMARPVAYLFEEVPRTSLRSEILGMGNPLLFWGSLATIPYLAVAWRRKPDWRAGFVLVAILGQYLPWFAARRPLFLFYMTPITPFLVLAAACALRDLARVRLAGSRSRPLLPLAAVFVVLSVASFAYFWPILVGSPLSESAWRARIWFPLQSPWFAERFPWWNWV